VVGYFSFLARNYQLDDALIYLRYVKNFHEGFGLVYNPGEKFNGLTSPLFTYVSLAASFLSSNFQLTTTIISALFLAIASILGGIIFSNGKWESLFTAVIIGSFGYFYATFGMETPLFIMLIGFSLYLYKVDSKYFVIALALLIITRFEGAFLAMVIAADYLIRNRRLPNTKILALSMIVLSLPFVFNYFYYGEFLPATASAKIGQGQSGFWDGSFRFLNIEYGEFRNEVQF
jgi:arabinofuranosyltransferase